MRRNENYFKQNRINFLEQYDEIGKMTKTQNRIYKISIALSTIFLMLTSASVKAEIKHVLELYTSQSCYSCPPAEELLGKIATNFENVLSLEFHVDYWNSINYGSHGQWQDPYSSSAYSKRQRDYNELSLDGRKGVYTPQMIVDGRSAFVGSQSPRAYYHLQKASKFVLSASAQVSKAGKVEVQVDGKHDSPADVWLITIDKKQTTVIPFGENHGKTLDNYNIVRSMQSIGVWNGKQVKFETEIGELSDNQNCAVIVQAFNSSRQAVNGPILGAALCEPV